MGLDMYLSGKKYLNYNQRPLEDGYELKERTLELGYWRKHPNLHGFIVNTFADGKDDCEEIRLSAADLEKIIAAVKENKLPNTSGFFFGASTGDDEEIKDDLKILNGALAWVQEKDSTAHRYLVYRASW